MAEGHPENHDEKAYRQRRLGDAAKTLPLLASILMILPAIWTTGPTTTVALIYIFASWLLMIVAIAVISKALTRSLSADKGRDAERGTER